MAQANPTRKRSIRPNTSPAQAVDGLGVRSRSLDLDDPEGLRPDGLGQNYVSVLIRTQGT